jgi:hypothetical protein
MHGDAERLYTPLERIHPSTRSVANDQKTYS